jgi:hypothetical protein
VVCYDFGCREVNHLQGREDIRMIRGDVHLSLDMEVKESGFMLKPAK